MNARENTRLGFACLFLLGASMASAGQKGLGDATGMARENEKPPIIKLSGKVTEVKVGPCEHTTGKADIGFHLILQAEEGKRVNLHLGPADALKKVRDRISIGQSIDAEVFRTKAMPADAYIAKTLTLGKKVIPIRDDDLRPVWAVPRGSGKGRGKSPGRKRGANRRTP